MKIRIIFFVLIGFSLLTCSKENSSPGEVIQDGVVVEKKPKWKRWTTDDGIHRSFTGGQITYNDGFVAINRKNGLDYLALFDGETGDIIWEWRDLIGIDTRMDLFFTHIYENYLVYQRGSRTYCIDLESGETVWSAQRHQPFHNYISGFRYNYFLTGKFDYRINGINLYGLFIGDVRYPGIEQWIHPRYDTTRQSMRGNLGAPGMPLGFTRDGQDYLIMAFGEGGEDWLVEPYCALYNLTREEWVYDRAPLTVPPHARNSVDGRPIIEGDRVYFTPGHHVVCHNLWTGEQIWRFDSNGNFVFGGMMVHNGRVYAQSEADALWCLDAETGEVLWKGPHLGTTSKMAHLNGILYIVEGGHLYALDMITGEIYWKIVSPDHECCDENFKREINVLPGKDGEKGLVLTSTYLSAVAYEAIR